jgi:nicotinamidase-related amidase
MRLSKASLKGIIKMSKIALLSIYFQKGFDEPLWVGVRNNLDAEVKMAMLLSRWRSNRFPVIHIQHCSKEEDSPLK